ncbi:MAG: mannose-1-phosphate guanylyltransferase/mannose-6-phosphate isomerase [Candidatus Omnitrophota bacterium]|nr:mannose-1-phosphate guanylyltransferase/mannose-6-phosphate isomerase [Candidatus Omnitrophota bacterium]
MSNHNYALLLAGGQGSRFWPQSRVLEPKQFLSLNKPDSSNKTQAKEESLFEQTILRVKPLISPKNIFIATSELYRIQVLEYANKFKIPFGNIIFEPEGKNTAPCIGAVCRLINLIDEEAKIAILPCDHLIGDKDKFLSVLNSAFNACDDNLVIFGIPPSRPATGYGYIKVKAPGSKRQAPSQKSHYSNIYEVERFTEKPDLKTAQRFIREKKYFWNSGIFVGPVKLFLEEVNNYSPVIYKQLLQINSCADIDKAWIKMPFISFDYAVLEKSKRLLMFKAKGLSWSDLGSWQSWDELLAKDKAGNLLRGDIINLDSRNITVLGKNHLIATIGLEDLIIVDTPDALLVTKKDRSEEVKKIVDILKTNKRQEHYFHRTVKRPWGSYTVLDLGTGFKIKLVEVKPGHSLSLQYHKKRSEHWVVVEGKAKITKNKKSYCICANESTYIPASCVHRLTNTGDSILKIVEVQTGTYLEEDDIIRIKDDFGRT